MAAMVVPLFSSPSTSQITATIILLPLTHSEFVYRRKQTTKLYTNCPKSKYPIRKMWENAWVFCRIPKSATNQTVESPIGFAKCAEFPVDFYASFVYDSFIFTMGGILVKRKWISGILLVAMLLMLTACSLPIDLPGGAETLICRVTEKAERLLTVEVLEDQSPLRRRRHIVGPIPRPLRDYQLVSGRHGFRHIFLSGGRHRPR